MRLSSNKGSSLFCLTREFYMLLYDNKCTVLNKGEMIMRTIINYIIGVTKEIKNTWGNRNLVDRWDEEYLSMTL